MKINDNKLLLLSSNLEDASIRDISNMLSFQLKDMNDKLKYLGYFIKPNNYRISDWKWLIHKFEKRLSNWSYIWVSLGGKLTLLKVVLSQYTSYHWPTFFLQFSIFLENF